MNITYTDGDLLASDEFAIAHGCNTRGVMGAGIAKQIARTYPVAEQRYRRACLIKTFRLGSVQPIEVANRVVFNLGTQVDPGANATPWGIFLSFANLIEYCKHNGIYDVGIPRIGAGIGGLTWEQVTQSIQEADMRTNSPVRFRVYDIQPFVDWNARNAG